MPYKVKKEGAKWITYNPLTGKVYGTHDTKADAEAQAALLHAKTGHSIEVDEEEE